MRVLVVQDHPLLASAIARVLESEEDLTVCGIARRGDEAAILAAREMPAVVLMDYRLPDVTGPAAAMQIRSAAPTAAIVFHSAEESEDALLDAIDAGAIAYLTKAATADEIIEAVRKAAVGEVLIPVGLFAKAIARQRKVGNEKEAREKLLAEFTPRELDVLKLLAEGEDTQTLARRLGIAPHTVEWHVTHVIEKLRVHSKLQAVIAAARLGLIEIQRTGDSTTRPLLLTLFRSCAHHPPVAEGIVQGDVSRTDGTYFNVPGVARVTWDPTCKASVIEQHGWANPAEFRAANQAIIRALKEHRGSRVLGDLREMRAIQQSDQDWAKTEWLPEILALGLRQMALVIAKSGLTMMNVEAILSRVPGTELDIAYFATIEEARAWLARPTSITPATLEVGPHPQPPRLRHILRRQRADRVATSPWGVPARAPTPVADGGLVLRSPVRLQATDKRSSTATGSCTYFFAVGTTPGHGLCVYTGGTGKLAGFHANVEVGAATFIGSGIFPLLGTYWFDRD